MTIGDSVLKILKEQLLPEIGEIKLGMVGFARVQEALVARLDRMEQEAVKRFELVDKRFEQIDKRFEQIDKRFEQIDKRFELMEAQMRCDKAEHARAMELLDKRMERLEEKMTYMVDRHQTLQEAVGKLTLLGDYVRRVDELAADLRELRRRQEEFERRVQADVLKLFPKPVTG